MKTSPQEFQTCLDAPEGARLEFKSATGGFHFDELVKYCVALANEGGGKILLGISDQRPRPAAISTTVIPGRMLGKMNSSTNAAFHSS